MGYFHLLRCSILLRITGIKLLLQLYMEENLMMPVHWRSSLHILNNPLIRNKLNIKHCLNVL